MERAKSEVYLHACQPDMNEFTTVKQAKLKKHLEGALMDIEARKNRLILAYGI